MSKITISGDTIKPKKEIESQLLSLVRSRLSAIEEEISEICVELNDFTNKYNFTNQEFQSQFKNGKLGDDRDFFIWDGLLTVLADLQSEQETLMEII